MRDDARSPVWGGATLGLLVGLVLGAFVGRYWTTLLYSVLIGAAAGAGANVLAWAGQLAAARGAMKQRRRSREFDEAFPFVKEQQLRDAEELLRQHAPTEFASTPNVGAECIDVVRMLEEEQWWRAGYGSVESFYEAHEDRHPDIRAYAAVRREVPMEDALDPPAGIGEIIARRIARSGRGTRMTGH